MNKWISIVAPALTAVMSALLILLQPMHPAHAGTNPVVYHSPGDDGARPPEPVTVPPGGNFVVHLYMDEADGSSDASVSNVCGGGGGKERCGWELTVDATGQVDFVSFTASGDVVAGLTSGAQPVLRFNGGAPVLGELGPVKLGDLEISSLGDGAVDLASGAVVDSTQAKVVMAPTTVITVPEPGQGSLLVAGAAALYLMQRSRARSRAQLGRSDNT